MTSPDETAEILAILGAEPDDIEIPELGVRTSRRGALAAFWDGYSAGRKGEPLPEVLDYDDPAVYRRAHQRGRVSRKELT